MTTILASRFRVALVDDFCHENSDSKFDGQRPEITSVTGALEFKHHNQKRAGTKVPALLQSAEVLNYRQGHIGS